jgi:hypothetical protein
MSALHRGFALGQLRARPIGSIQSKRRSRGTFAEMEEGKFGSSMRAKSK